jgi:hypothetical protein
MKNEKCFYVCFAELGTQNLRAKRAARGIVAEPAAPLAARVMERIARREERSDEAARPKKLKKEGTLLRNRNKNYIFAA